MGGIFLNLLDLVGKIGYLLPRRMKKWLGHFCFLTESEHLPRASSRGLTFGLVLGGAPGRVEHAARLYKAGKLDYVVASGGIGDYSINREVPEAELYRRELLRLGVPLEAILTETESKTTAQNIQLSLPLILSQAQGFGMVRIVLITNDYHLRRSLTLLRKLLAEYRSRGDQRVNSVELYWSASDPSVSAFLGERMSAPDEETDVSFNCWSESEKGCGSVLKEAIRLFQLRLRGQQLFS